MTCSSRSPPSPEWHPDHPTGQRLPGTRGTGAGRHRHRADARYVLLARDLVRRPIGDIKLARRIEAVTRTGADARPAIALVLDELRAIAAGIS